MADKDTYAVPQAALGPEGDFPVAYAVFRVTIDHDAGIATDAHYVHASKSYCRAISRDFEGVIGHSHQEILEADEAGETQWLAQCYQVVALGETIRGFVYDPIVRDWTCYCLAPSGTPDCCVYSFIRTTVDDEQRSQLLSTVEARTSYFISEMLSQLAAEQSYESAMNGMLAMMSTVIHADRLGVFECGGEATTMTFELCAEGVTPQVGIVGPISKQTLSYWFHNVTKDRVVLVPNITVIERMSKLLYGWCVRSNVHSLLAAPFYDDGEIVGFFGAYNYQIDADIDLNQLFEAVSTFIAARIENRQLIDSLQRAGTHDALTDVLNRRGADAAINEFITRHPDESYVLVLIDLDDFKRVNDVYGHGAGDEALRSLTRTLQETFPTEAIISRNGGDEFMLLLSGEAAENASSLLAQLTQHGVHFDYEDQALHLTLSVGYARYPEQGRSIHDLATKADTALYAVKMVGKSGFGKYTEGAEAHLRPQLGFAARDILASIPYPMLISRADPSGDILFASSELARMLGYSGMYELVRATGGAFAGLVHPDYRVIVPATLEEHGEHGVAGTAVVFSFRALCKNGTALSVEARSRFVTIEESGRAVYTLLKPSE